MLIDEVHDNFGVGVLRESHERSRVGSAHHSGEITKDDDRISLSHCVNVPRQKVEQLTGFIGLGRRDKHFFNDNAGQHVAVAVTAKHNRGFGSDEG